MIDVNNVSRHYGHTTAVDGVSFAAGENEIIGLLGQNGAGKTTIMRMLAGYLEPCGGSITINGENMACAAAQVQQTLGYLPENLPVYPDMQVFDYLDYVATLKGIASRERRAAVRRVILATELASRAMDSIKSLSRGLRQRVGVAQALLGEPRLLILDEPTNGLDPEQTEHMRELIKDLASHATVILSTHIMQEVEALCDRVLILRAGTLVLDEHLASLHQSNRLLVRVSGAVDQTSKSLGALPGMKLVQTQSSDEHSTDFLVELQQATLPEEVAQRIVAMVQESGGTLLELRPQQRSLESVFREANR